MIEHAMDKTQNLLGNFPGPRENPAATETTVWDMIEGMCLRMRKPYLNQKFILAEVNAHRSGDDVRHVVPWL